MRAILCLALFAATAHAGDWPQWLGPHRDGTSPEIVKPWTAPPKVLWRVPVGEGHGSPVVAGDQVILHSRVPGKDAEQTVAYDAGTGKDGLTAVHARDPFSSPFGVGPRSTPAVADDGQVISFGVTGRLAAMAPPRGAKWWNANPLQQFDAPVPKFGVSTSPLIDGDRVIVLAGGKAASLVALDRKSGEVLWKALDDSASYASPIITEHAGRRQLVALTGEAVVSLDPATGELLWRHPFRDAINESSTTPLRVGDLIVASSVTLGSVGLKLGTNDGKPAVTEAWKNSALCCYFSTPVEVGDKHVYMVTSSLVAALTKKPECALNCVDVTTGKVLWTKAKVGKFHAALIRTGDNKLLMHSDTGEIVLIDADPKEYRELARTKVCGPTWRTRPWQTDGFI